ncbi:MAG: bifunctional [glutamine synthetase] adenylyltransferase/[glutamine synthetase]-adenylyl-L-tyrosine phosphorylase [Actinomycetota bacterium]
MSEMTGTGVLDSRRAALAGASTSLTSFLEKDDRALDLLASEEPLPSAYVEVMKSAYSADGLPGLRLEKRRRLLEIAARDVAGELRLEEVGRALADLADASIVATLEHLDPPAGFAVFAMGKLGGRELNYSSDIDLMFLAEDMQAGTRTARSLVEALGEHSPEGRPFRIDLNLRPEGRSGALVRSLAAYVEYYRRWAQPWEFQALIKARLAAGDVEIGEAFHSETLPFIYPGEISEERVAEIRKMKERVESHAQLSARRSKTSEANDVKLGPGGIRDIEFSVQLLQLVHGSADPGVRGGNTLAVIDALTDSGYLAEEDAAGLEVAYRWLRNVEHRLQLWRERQVHHIPTDPDEVGRLARSLGFGDSPAASATSRFEDRHRAVLADVRGRFEKLFYRPMIESLSDAPGTKLSSDALKDRLRVLGYKDVDRAARTLSGLVSGTSRRAKLFRVLTPALLRFLAATPMPDEGLFAFLRLGEAIHGRLDALTSMRDNPPGLALLARVLGSGRFLGEMLAHVPEEIYTIAAPTTLDEPKDRDRLVHGSKASLEWRGPERLLEGLRRFKRRETLSIGIADVAGEADVTTVGTYLSDLADACLEAALGDGDEPFAVIGMGKLGGRELGYSSDIDVMFVYEGDPQVGEKRAEELVRAIGEVTPEGQTFRIDAALRPEGKAGPLARSFHSYLEYYGRWSQPWEHQALLKARVAAGNKDLGERFIAATREFAYPFTLRSSALSEIRHLKARMERERIPRGTDPRRHIKLGPGGISDVEFAVQIIQLEHAHTAAELRVVGTLEAIEGARAAGFLSRDDELHLTDAYRFLLRIRNRLFFMYARPVDALPVKPEELEALGVALGFRDQPRQELEEAYRRTTRRARKVAERLIFAA